MPERLDPERVGHFGRLIRASHTKRVNREALWRAFAEAFPKRPCGPDERVWMLGAIEELVGKGLISLPSGKGQRWDRSALPHLPNSVDLLRAVTVPQDQRWRSHPWHPMLQWVADLVVLSPEQQAFLFRVHEGFVQGTFDQPAPMKYRSLQLTGDEKRLADLMKTKLFEPGRLSLNLLGCLPDTCPLAWESVADNDNAIVFENIGPFMVARQVLSSMPSPPFGIVVHGAGMAFQAGVGYLATIGRPVQSLRYVGDFDREGLWIPTAARECARRAGLPEVLPATELHRAMLASAAALGHPEGWPSGGRRSDPADIGIADFVSAAIRQQVLTILLQGNRVPEETLGPCEMLSAWC
jgi:hypothetical protein